jgi:hypothetical protein
MEFSRLARGLRGNRGIAKIRSPLDYLERARLMILNDKRSSLSNWGSVFIFSFFQKNHFLITIYSFFKSKKLFLKENAH